MSARKRRDVAGFRDPFLSENLDREIVLKQAGRNGLWLLFVLALVLFSGCGGSSSDGGSLNGFGQRFSYGDGGSFNGGPIGPVSGGSGQPSGFGPNTPGPNPPGNAISQVIFAATGSDINSYAVAPDGGVTLLESGLDPEGNITEVILSPDGETLYGLSYNGNRIFTYDIDADNGTLTQLGSGIEAGEYPSDLDFVGDRLFAYAANANAAGFSGVNTVTSFLVETDGQLAANAASPVVPTGSTPTSIAVNDAGTKMYVTNRSTAGQLRIFDISPAGVLTADPLSPLNTDGIPFKAVTSRDGNFLFLSMWAEGSMHPANVASYRILANGDLQFVNSVPSPSTAPYDPYQHPSLPVIYVGGSDKVQAYSIAPDGSLALLGAALDVPDAVFGVPDLTGRFLYVFGFFSGNLTWFSIDQTTGAINPTPQGSLNTGTINMLEFVPGPDFLTP